MCVSNPFMDERIVLLLCMDFVSNIANVIPWTSFSQQSEYQSNGFDIQSWRVYLEFICSGQQVSRRHYQMILKNIKFDSKTSEIIMKGLQS